MFQFPKILPVKVYLENVFHQLFKANGILMIFSDITKWGTHVLLRVTECLKDIFSSLILINNVTLVCFFN